jgi:V/A-type H+-transporting ATPase subunit E
MKGLETGKEKVKKICDVLRHETIEPAKQEAKEIVDNAKREAEEIVHAAKREAKKILHDAQTEVQKKEMVFQASLKQASRQAVETLKTDIENKLFHPGLTRLLTQPLKDPNIIAKLIETVITALQKDGIDANLSVYIPASIPARAINELLVQKILEKLKEKSVLIGGFNGGIEVKLHKENITIEISENSLREVLSQFIRKDFRELFFGSV